MRGEIRFLVGSRRERYEVRRSFFCLVFGVYFYRVVYKMGFFEDRVGGYGVWFFLSI